MDANRAQSPVHVHFGPGPGLGLTLTASSEYQGDELHQSPSEIDHQRGDHEFEMPRRFGIGAGQVAKVEVLGRDRLTIDGRRLTVWNREGVGESRPFCFARETLPIPWP